MAQILPAGPPASSAASPTVRFLSETPDDVSRWQAYVEQAPDATIYHDIAWRTIFGSLRYKSYYLVAETAGKICGILPLFLVPSLTGQPRLVSVPFRDRGGPVFDNAAAFAALMTRAQSLKTDTNAAYVELKTLVPFSSDETFGVKLSRADYWVRSRTSLVNLEPQKLLKDIGVKARNKIRQAERAGVQIVELEASSTAIDSWYRIHQSSQQSLGLPPFPRHFFERLMTDLGARRLARLFEVHDETGKAIAGCIMLMDRKTAIYAYSASSPSMRHLRPNDIMLFRIICKMIEEGCAYFDFGADAPDQSGLLAFKRKWLAEQNAIPRYYVGSTIPQMIDSSAPRYAMVRNITRYLPLPVARAILAPLTRYFG
jgi:CelD/BcsL family acetyltransferase involved in cellulose biosynthesis